MAITQQQINNLNNEANENNALADAVQGTINSFNSRINDCNAQAANYATEANYYTQDARTLAASITAVASYVNTEIEKQKNFTINESNRVIEAAQNKIDTVHEEINRNISLVKNEVSASISGLQNETNNKIQQVKSETKSAISQQEKETADKILFFEKRVKDYTEQAKEAIRQNIQKVVGRLNNMRNPLTGLRERYEDVLVDMVELHRGDALSAEEYEKLDYPSVWYDYQNTSAFDYDMAGKVSLAPWVATIAMLTALEYDALELTAQRYSGYTLHAAEYDLLSKALLV